ATLAPGSRAARAQLARARGRAADGPVVILRLGGRLPELAERLARHVAHERALQGRLLRLRHRAVVRARLVRRRGRRAGLAHARGRARGPAVRVRRRAQQRRRRRRPADPAARAPLRPRRDRARRGRRRRVRAGLARRRVCALARRRAGQLRRRCHRRRLPAPARAVGHGLARHHPQLAVVGGRRRQPDGEPGHAAQARAQPGHVAGQAAAPAVTLAGPQPAAHPPEPAPQSSGPRLAQPRLAHRPPRPAGARHGLAAAAAGAARHPVRGRPRVVYNIADFPCSRSARHE
ncbi:uncharacterized protein V1510DRAFT_428352, partial [Dipodascopsis tothii]|uniref:uncharacterized protein n=1 Tax=Dipodascopsis tothii TaxID=44089 RepID=UPI0034CED73C